ncbi:MAG: MBL fold metallo-hydrolase [Clostridiales bacterium]|nr:MBL fold metallo-hydrolase [Clostridiales bacterium]
MKLVFIGACHEVTGSCTYLEVNDKKILVDFGMEQGIDDYENAKIPCNPSEIDMVLLTHAHIDHSGLLPFLYAGGFQGEIHATQASCSLCSIMLRDSAHIQEFEAEWRNRKGKRSGKSEYVPLYTMKDAEGAISKLVPHNYDERIAICEGVEVRFIDAGHLLGSSSIELWAKEGEFSKKLVFSGDIGNYNQPLIRDPSYIDEADIVVMESTYGDRRHDTPPDFVSSLAEILEKTFKRGGNLVIPSFAVGRTQELLYFMRIIKDKKLVKYPPNFQVYVDSPLAIEATNMFIKNKESCYDEEAMEFVNSGINPLSFDGLNIAATSDESKAINFDSNPKVIISASGMCEAGRIKHHLKHNLWNAKNTVLFVGYQAANTLGRRLLDGAKAVKLFGEEVVVKAEIKNLYGMSGHADLDGLINWIKNIKNPKQVFVVHGESSTADTFTKMLNEEYDINAYAPYSGTEYDVLNEEFIVHAKPVEIKRKSYEKVNTVYARLLASLDKLTKIVKSSEGRTNADLSKLADRINELTNKWEK